MSSLYFHLEKSDQKGAGIHMNDIKVAKKTTQCGSVITNVGDGWGNGTRMAIQNKLVVDWMYERRFEIGLKREYLSNQLYYEYYQIKLTLSDQYKLN